MGISNCSSKSNISSNRTIIWALITWISSVWPTVRMGCESVLLLEQSILLLDAIPRLFFGTLVKYWFGVCSEITVGRNELTVCGIFPLESFGKNKNIVSTSEWIWEVGNWLDYYLRVLSCGLITT